MIVRRVRAAFFACIIAAAVVVVTTSASAQMPDPRSLSGVPLPAGDLPVGTVSVRVIRGTFANNLPGVDVVFTVNGKPSTVKTDEQGRAQLGGLPAGARVKAVATVGAERLETQEVTLSNSGIRFVLAAALDGTEGGPAPAPGSTGQAAGPSAVAAAPGSVVLGQESRVVVDYSDERLNIFYVVPIINSGASPVDIGGPLVFDLPTEARGASLLEGATPQAKVNGARVTVLGPFQPGTTTMSVGFELPFSGGSVELAQKWPAPLQELTVFGLKSGNLDIASPQFTNKQATTQQGQPLVVGLVPAMAAGQTLTVSVSGLPHHATWPRYVALTLAGAIVSVGLWAAFVPTGRRPVA